jgi:4-aminobutyrate aminotransferase/(S)-3-amino-2-methylpropionate transaminase
MNTKELYDQYVITSMVASIEPVVVERAKGCTLYAADGKEYLDCFAGIAVVNAGHGHPKVLQAAKEQMDKLVHCCSYVYYSPRTAELAEQLAKVTPGGLQKTFFSNSGAEAIEGAMRIAKQHTGHHEFVSLTHSFHGRSAATLSVTGNSGRKKGNLPYLSGVSFAPAPYCYRCPLRQTYPGCGVACAQAIDDTIRFHSAGEPAAFIAESVMGEGGIIVPPDEYFKIANEVIKKWGGLLLIDEVQCGFGRTGYLFAIEHYGVVPDIMCMAKGIADGFPLGAFIVLDEIAKAFKPGDHLSTFGGNPVSCAAALANLQVFTAEKVLDNVKARSRQLLDRFNALKERCALVGDVRGRGLMLGLELVSDAKKTPAAEKAKAVRVACREKGVLIGVGGVSGNVLRVQPPLVISQAECDRAASVLEEAVLAAAR